MSGRNQARIQRMTRVTGVALDAALSRLRAAAQDARDIEAEITSLDADRRCMCGDVTDPATRAGVELLWHRWAEAKRAELNKSLARARVAETEAQRAATRAFGRNDALTKVIARIPVRS